MAPPISPILDKGLREKREEKKKKKKKQQCYNLHYAMGENDICLLVLKHF